MDNLNIIWQSVWDLLNIFRTVFLFLYFGMGVVSAFWMKWLGVSLLSVGVIFLVGKSVKGFDIEQLLPYLAVLVIGFGIATIVKWATQRQSI